MEVAVLGHCKKVPEGSLGHLDNNFLDGVEFIDDKAIVRSQAIERTQDAESFVLPALKYEPPGRFRKFHDEADNDDGKNDLEGNGESPRDLVGIQIIKSKV